MILSVRPAVVIQRKIFRMNVDKDFVLTESRSVTNPSFAELRPP
jgi:hypothetical protein